MNKSKAGRPVDLNGINIDEIDKWMHYEAMVRKVLICQSIMALSKGVPMSEVCRALGVTREGVRLWKEKFRAKGLEGVLHEGKVAEALHTALTMPVEERRERYQALITRVRKNDVTSWRESFLDALKNAGPGTAS